MIAALALTLMLAAADAAPAAAPAQDDEITIIARKLDLVELNVRPDRDGRLQCTVVQSSGMPRLDSQLCKATARCVRKGNWTSDAVRQCVEQAKPALVADVRSRLKERRVEIVQVQEPDA